VVPGFEQMAEVDSNRREFQITGRTLHEPRFPRPGGRAALRCHELPSLPSGQDLLRLMTVRSEGQFNTVVYEDYDLYRGQDRRDVILLHPNDMQRFGLQSEQRVVVTSEVGSMSGILARSFSDIRAGNALMYYPECNRLVPRSVDPNSRTPAFKNVLIRIKPHP
jgi:anaerobic selenocysteine-containing dehydrogenase